MSSSTFSTVFSWAHQILADCSWAISLGSIPIFLAAVALTVRQLTRVIIGLGQLFEEIAIARRKWGILRSKANGARSGQVAEASAHAVPARLFEKSEKNRQDQSTSDKTSSLLKATTLSPR
jgi:hypothetical protein